MSSKRHVRRSRCERKIKYRSAGEARHAARGIAEKHCDYLTEYPCGSHWHLGHAPRNVDTAKAYKVAAHQARRRIDQRAA